MECLVDTDIHSLAYHTIHSLCGDLNRGGYYNKIVIDPTWHLVANNEHFVVQMLFI